MGKRLRDFNPYSIYKKWYGREGCFSCFFKSTNFVSLKHYPDFEPDSAEERNSLLQKEILETAALYNPEDTVFLIEVPGKEAIQAAFSTLKERGLKPVLTFNHIYHPHGLLGTKEEISLLLEYGERIEEGETNGWAFIIDSMRYGNEEPETLRRFFNNQYQLTEEDLPPVEMLNDLGYKQVAYITTGDMKEDIGWYIEYLDTNGIKVFKHVIQGDV